jgi:microcystin-dependent protein
MAEPFLSEIRMFGFNFPPRNWSLCDGQLLPISQNQSLFSLLGTTYGGDGRTSFALPDLRGRTPMHFGSSGGPTHPLGEKGGEEAHPLSVNEIPAHTHEARALSDDGTTPIPDNTVMLANSAPAEIYRQPTDLVDMHAGTIANNAGGQGHQNMQPYLVISFCIALVGTFPSRN